MKYRYFSIDKPGKNISMTMETSKEMEIIITEISHNNTTEYHNNVSHKIPISPN